MKRGILGLVGLLFLAMVAVQAVGAAIAIRRKQDLGESVPDPASDEVALAAIFAPLDFRSTASNFRGGSLTCMFGGGIVDLRGATLAPGGATLRVEAFDGGAQILVPPTWRIELGGTNVFGGSNDMRSNVDLAADAPTLRIEGWAIFGGFGIASEDPRGSKDRPAIPDAAGEAEGA